MCMTHGGTINKLNTNKKDKYIYEMVNGPKAIAIGYKVTQVHRFVGLRLYGL